MNSCKCIPHKAIYSNNGQIVDFYPKLGKEVIKLGLKSLKFTIALSLLITDLIFPSISDLKNKVRQVQRQIE